MNKIARKAIVGVVALIVIGVILLDAQRSGEQVYASPRLSFSRQETHSVSFEISPDGVGEPHTVTVSGRGDKLALAWSLSTPDGEMIVEERETMRRKGLRFFEFTPQAAGEYNMTVERVRGALADGMVEVDRDGVSVNPHRREGAAVRVTTKDRRIIMPLLSRLRM